MKSGLQRIFSGILVIALAITLSVPALATDLKAKPHKKDLSRIAENVI